MAAGEDRVEGWPGVLWPFGLVAFVLLATSQLGFSAFAADHVGTIHARRQGATVMAAVSVGLALWAAREMALREHPRGDYALALAWAGILGVAFGVLAKQDTLLRSYDAFSAALLAFLLAMATLGFGLFLMLAAPSPPAIGALLVSLVLVGVAAFWPRERRAAMLRLTTLGLAAGFAVALSFYATFLASQEQSVLAALERRNTPIPAWAGVAALALAALLLRRARR